ncbi:Hypothetical protein, putative [Bodo saltans]|uniref:Roadblock/LAMTOR2 domain-containing protein n=1 Tax=Bodo saltans TaxID=75058 RepID=A0A0S4JUR6_BODSA|nr:Hypothetical protein, putative [Bodo saltans]|eukprot:CUG93962.1 Hypothetical protein, putative [Bodo saltans]
MTDNVTTIELYFDQLIGAREITQVLITDLQGRIILSRPSGGAASQGGDGDDQLQQQHAVDVPESNVVVSGARAITSLEGLKLGTPQYISVQFHDSMGVQFVEGSCIITLVGARSHDQCMGGLIALAQHMRSSVPTFRETMKAISDASRT